MRTTIHNFLHWLADPQSFFAYGILAAITILALWGLVHFIDVVFGVSKHWHEKHKHRH